METNAHYDLLWVILAQQQQSHDLLVYMTRQTLKVIYFCPFQSADFLCHTYTFCSCTSTEMTVWAHEDHMHWGFFNFYFKQSLYLVAVTMTKGSAQYTACAKDLCLLRKNRSKFMYPWLQTDVVVPVFSNVHTSPAFVLCSIKKKKKKKIRPGIVKTFLFNKSGQHKLICC